MKKENDILDNIGNKNPFTVPDNYFENFVAGIENKISSTESDVKIMAEKKEGKTVSLLEKMKPYFYAAAMFIMVFFAANYISNSTTDDNENPANVATNNEPEYTIDVNDVLLSSFDENVIIDYYIENE